MTTRLIAPYDKPLPQDSNLLNDPHNPTTLPAPSATAGRAAPGLADRELVRSLLRVFSNRRPNLVTQVRQDEPVVLSGRASRRLSAAGFLVLVAVWSWLPSRYTHDRLPTSLSLTITLVCVPVVIYLLISAGFINRFAKRRLARRRSGDPRKRRDD